MAIARVIKFRVVDEDDKKMYLVDKLSTTEWITYIQKAEGKGNVVFMQYTGRDDKNGVEIYEDDIVIDSEGRYGVVYWNLDDCQFLVDFQKDMEIEQISSNFIVCGNVWENLDLLK